MVEADGDEGGRAEKQLARLGSDEGGTKSDSEVRHESTVGIDDDASFTDGNSVAVINGDNAPSQSGLNSKLGREGSAFASQRKDDPGTTEIVETAGDSVTVTVRGHIQSNFMAVLSSLMERDVKDMRTGDGSLTLVLSVPDEERNAQHLEQIIQASIEKAYRLERTRRGAAKEFCSDAISGSNKTSSVPSESTAYMQLQRLERELLDKQSSPPTTAPDLVDTGLQIPGDSKSAPLDQEIEVSENMIAHRRSSVSPSIPDGAAMADVSTSLSTLSRLRRLESDIVSNGLEQKQSSVQSHTLSRNQSRISLEQDDNEKWQGDEILAVISAGECVNETTDLESSRDDRGLAQAATETVCRRPRRGDPSPGAFSVPARAFGGVPVWAEERNSRTDPSAAHEIVEETSSQDRESDINVLHSFSPPVEAFRVDELAQEHNLRRRIFDEAVEADVVDTGDLRKRKMYRMFAWIFLTVMLSGVAIALGVALSREEGVASLRTANPTPAPSGSPTETHRPTLEKVLSRGKLLCGANDDIPGLYFLNNKTNSIEGFSIDLCKAIAAATIGDSNSIHIVPINASERFKVLLSGSVDVLTRSETHTMARELVELTTGVGFSFSSPYLYSGLVFSGIPELVDCAEELDTFFQICRQLKICVSKGTSLEEVVDTLLPLPFIQKTDSTTQSFLEGACNVIAAEPVGSQEAIFRLAGYDGPFKVGTALFSREPLAIVTRQDDPEWSEIVDAVLNALWAAEAQNVTQATAMDFRVSSEFTPLREPSFVNAIASVGNYGEVYSRNLDRIVPRSDLNSLNLNGSTGLLYYLPFGPLERTGSGPIQGGTLQSILDRGYLRCGLTSNATGFSHFDTIGSEWTGLDVSFCRVIAAAVFSGDMEDKIQFLSFSDADAYKALKIGNADVLAGDTRSLALSVYEIPSLTGLSFSSPYFYGSQDGNLSDTSTRSLATRQDDIQWSTFVYWTLMATVFAEDMFIFRQNSEKMPVVRLFGDSYIQMFRDIIASSGNYAEIYNDSLKEQIPRAKRNLLNTIPHGPQQFPFEIFP